MAGGEWRVGRDSRSLATLGTTLRWHGPCSIAFRFGQRRSSIPRSARDQRVLPRAAATDQKVFVVEEKEARGSAEPDGDSGQGAVLVVELEHAAKVDGADDVDVVKEEGFVRAAGRVGCLTALGLG